VYQKSIHSRTSFWSKTTKVFSFDIIRVNMILSFSKKKEHSFISLANLILKTKRLIFSHLNFFLIKKRVKKVTKICLTKRSWIGYLYCRVCLSKEKDFASCILSTKNIFFLFLRMMIFFEKNGTFFTFCTFWQNAKTQKRK
jgi:hypothetical protein